MIHVRLVSIIFSREQTRVPSIGVPYLDLVRDPVEESVGPTTGGMHREEGSANARVHGDEPLVSLPQIVLAQNFAHGADIKTCVVSVDYPNVWRLGQQVHRACLAVENEDEVGVTMQSILDEKGQVLPRIV